MPRNVRNFWIELEVDGKKTKIATGPESKDGGFRVKFYYRREGVVNSGGCVEGYVHGGRLHLIQDVNEVHDVYR